MEINCRQMLYSPQKALTWGFAKSPDEPTEAAVDQAIISSQTHRRGRT